MPTLTEIPGHPAAEYAPTVLDRFENTGVRDQIARLCIDGTAKFPTFLIPTVERQLEPRRPGRARRDRARRLGALPRHRRRRRAQAFDSSADEARRHAANALADPVAFLDFDAVFGTALHESPRFRTASSAAYHRIVDDGALAAMRREPAPGRT